VRKPHLHLLALAARALEGFSVGESANVVSYILVDIARDLAGVCCRTPRLESASGAVIGARPIRQDAALVDDEQLARRANMYVALMSLLRSRL
jgi:hypothetical protein